MLLEHSGNICYNVNVNLQIKEQTMKILHTADLHLDSAFCGGGETLSQSRRARQREVFKKIFELAVSENCDMVLIAGDLFDTSFVTPETRTL